MDGKKGMAHYSMKFRQKIGNEHLKREFHFLCFVQNIR